MKKMILTLVVTFVALLPVRADYFRMIETISETNNVVTTNIVFKRYVGTALNLATDTQIPELRVPTTRIARTSSTYPNRIGGMGSPEALREHLATKSRDISINIFQDVDGEQIDLKFGVGKLGTWANYSTYVADVKTQIKKFSEEAFLSANYRPGYPIQILWSSGHFEYIPSVKQFFTAVTFFGRHSFTPVLIQSKLTVSQQALDSILVQLPQSIGYMFTDSSKGWVQFAKLEVTRKSDGELLESKNTFFDPSEYDIYTDYIGGVYVEHRHLTRGGINSSEDVKITLTFLDGTALSYDGNGNLIVPNPEIRIVLENGRPVLTVVNSNEEVQIQSAPTISGPWTDLATTSPVRPAAVVTPEALTGFFRIKP